MSEAARDDIIPIPLREDFTARVHVPPNMTEAEARKIGAVLLAYAGVAPSSTERPAA